MKNSIFIAIGLFLACICIVACSQCNRWLGLEDDHAVEEIGESLLYQELGLDLDFSPESPEYARAKIEEGNGHDDPR